MSERQSVGAPATGPRVCSQDGTLRDGMNAVPQRFALDGVTAIAAALDAAGVDDDVALDLVSRRGASGRTMQKA
jgi:hypothetical protein